MCIGSHDPRGIFGITDDGKAGFHNDVGHTPQTIAGCRRKRVVSMRNKMYMLNHQRQLVGVYGSKMNESTRAYNDMKLRLLEAEAYDELKRDFIQSA